MAAILNSVGGRRQEMSGNVDGVISKSGLIENVGVEVEIASLSQTVQKLLPFFRFYGRHLGFQAFGCTWQYRQLHRWIPRPRK